MFIAQKLNFSLNSVHKNNFMIVMVLFHLYYCFHFLQFMVWLCNFCVYTSVCQWQELIFLITIDIVQWHVKYKDAITIFWFIYVSINVLFPKQCRLNKVLITKYSCIFVSLWCNILWSAVIYLASVTIDYKNCCTKTYLSFTALQGMFITKWLYWVSLHYKIIHIYNPRWWPSGKKLLVRWKLVEHWKMCD